MIELIGAAASVLGSALKEAPSTNYSGMGGTDNMFDASGFVVNFGSGTVEAKSGSVGAIPKQAQQNVYGPLGSQTTGVSWPIVAGVVLVLAGAGYYFFLRKK